MFMYSSTSSPRLSLSADRIADLRLAASKMTGANRRAFQAEMLEILFGQRPPSRNGVRLGTQQY